MKHFGYNPHEIKQVKQSSFDIMEEIMIYNFLGHLSAWNGPAVS